MTSSVGGEGSSEHTVAETGLKAGTIGLPGVLMQSVTTIAPAIAGLFTIPFNIVIPAVSSVALLAVGYYSLNPLPEYPINLAAPIVVAWLLIGVGILAYMLSRGREDWLSKAGDTVAEREETEAEHAGRSGLV